jgi:aminopeptidase
MSLEEYEDFVIGVGLLNEDNPVALWKEVSKHQEKIASFLSTKRDVRFLSVDTDEGSRFFGEVAIGTNYGITNFTKNILFDEKIVGTFHLAIGSGFPESGGNNESGVHWDMICDMRDGGKIFADDELIYENGKFIIDELV